MRDRKIRRSTTCIDQVKFFKKHDPRRTLYLSGGDVVKFEAVIQQYGVLATDDPRVISEFAAMMRAHRGGVEEITQEDYDDLREKKNPKQLSRPSWREEISNPEGLADTAVQPALPPAAAKFPAPVPPPTTKAARTKPSDFVPKPFKAQ